MLVLVYYVPEEALEKTKDAVFQAGAGNLGRYSECCWQVKGSGQFRPGNNSSPYSGVEGELYIEDEYRVEIVFEDYLKESIIKALVAAHPYETPAYHVLNGGI